MKLRFKYFIILICTFIITAALLFFIPKPPLLTNIPFSTAIYDQQGHLLRLTLSQDEKYRVYTPLADISPELIDATLLQEDRYFYQHFGINPFAMLKAGWQTYVIKSRRMGASTISMQLARLQFGIPSKKLFGKIWQMLRALQLELHYSKQQILEAYLNLTPYGGNIEGVGAASLIYFNKNANNLSLSEVLTLSVIPQNPTRRSTDIQQLKSMRDKLFKRWLINHPEDRDKKYLLNLPFTLSNTHSLPFIAPHFTHSVLNRRHANEHEIITTLDHKLQTLLERTTTNYLSHKKIFGVYNAAVLLVDSRDMAVKGLVGSANFFNQNISGQINGTETKRSPGSTLKPFIYGLALDQGLIHPLTVLKDVPSSFGSYNPENFDYDFMGPIQAKHALILSRNIPAIYLANLLKPNLYQLLEQAEINHLKAESYYGLALNLGGAELTMQELTSLYAMLANDGFWHPLRLRKTEPFSPGKRFLSPEASFLILDMLKDTPRPNMSYLKSTHHPLEVAWKTGTSSGYRDAWAVGIFGSYVLAVWVGNFDNTSNPAFVGKNIAAPLFFELIDAIKQEQTHLSSLIKFRPSMNLIKVEVCKASGLLPTRACPRTEKTWFIPGKSPIKTDTIYREITINKNTGLRSCHVDANTQFKVYEFWPSDLLKTFKQAGMQRKTPPLFEKQCLANSPLTLSPQIRSPQSSLSYLIHTPRQQTATIPLIAVTDADVNTLYWFINERFLAKARRDQPLLWHAQAGKFVVRVVDDHGLSDVQDIIVNTS